MPPVPSGGVVKLVGVGSTFGWIENWLVVRSERDLCVNRIDEDKMFFCSKDQDMIDKYLLRSISMVNPIFQTELEQTRHLGTGFQRRRSIYTKRHGPGLVMYTKKEAIISSSCTRRKKSQCISNLESLFFGIAILTRFRPVPCASDSVSSSEPGTMTEDTL
ncbi:hypothetical protein HID58_029658 [Brassica napus]|uniref:Uncharacterized protein n=1 Tax=Brassica napus TaxID=3708 RepID=A0ABQ8CDQ2_BRANA|nr:hypothetical protein HID58_029658 [Brassica napus]